MGGKGRTKFCTLSRWQCNSVNTIMQFLCILTMHLTDYQMTTIPIENVKDLPT